MRILGFQNFYQIGWIFASRGFSALGVFSQFDLRSDFHGQILTTFFHNGGFSQSQMAFSHKADFHNNFSQNPVTFHDEVFRESDVLQNCSKFYGGQICRTSLSLKTSSLKVTGFWKNFFVRIRHCEKKLWESAIVKKSCENPPL